MIYISLSFSTFFNLSYQEERWGFKTCRAKSYRSLSRAKDFLLLFLLLLFISSLQLCHMIYTLHHTQTPTITHTHTHTDTHLRTNPYVFSRMRFTCSDFLTKLITTVLVYYTILYCWMERFCNSYVQFIFSTMYC